MAPSTAGRSSSVPPGISALIPHGVAHEAAIERAQVELRGVVRVRLQDEGRVGPQALPVDRPGLAAVVAAQDGIGVAEALHLFVRMRGLARCVARDVPSPSPGEAV